MTKIKVKDDRTGAVVEYSSDTTLLEIMGVASMSLSDAAEKIAGEIKGLSAARALMILEKIADPNEGYFDAIEAHRRGDETDFVLSIVPASSINCSVDMSAMDPAKLVAAMADPEAEPEVEAEPGAEPEAEVEQLEAGDDLHSEPDASHDVAPEPEPEPDLGGLTPIEHGQIARLKDNGPDANPFDGGTENHFEWASGYNSADDEIKVLIEEGRKSGAIGDDQTSCPWKKGTDGERFWMQGWNDGANGA